MERSKGAERSGEPPPQDMAVDAASQESLAHRVAESINPDAGDIVSSLLPIGGDSLAESRAKKKAELDRLQNAEKHRTKEEHRRRQEQVDDALKGNIVSPVGALRAWTLYTHQSVDVLLPSDGGTMEGREMREIAIRRRNERLPNYEDKLTDEGWSFQMHEAWVEAQSQLIRVGGATITLNPQWYSALRMVVLALLKYWQAFAGRRPFRPSSITWWASNHQSSFHPYKVSGATTLQMVGYVPLYETHLLPASDGDAPRWAQFHEWPEEKRKSGQTPHDESVTHRIVGHVLTSATGVVMIMGAGKEKSLFHYVCGPAADTTAKVVVVPSEFDRKMFEKNFGRKITERHWEAEWIAFSFIHGASNVWMCCTIFDTLFNGGDATMMYNLVPSVQEACDFLKQDCPPRVAELQVQAISRFAVGIVDFVVIRSMGGRWLELMQRCWPKSPWRPVSITARMNDSVPRVPLEVLKHPFGPFGMPAPVRMDTDVVGGMVHAQMLLAALIRVNEELPLQPNDRLCAAQGTNDLHKALALLMKRMKWFCEEYLSSLEGPHYDRVSLYNAFARVESDESHFPHKIDVQRVRKFINTQHLKTGEAGPRGVDAVVLLEPERHLMLYDVEYGYTFEYGALLQAMDNREVSYEKYPDDHKPAQMEVYPHIKGILHQYRMAGVWPMEQGPLRAKVMQPERLMMAQKDPLVDPLKDEAALQVFYDRYATRRSSPLNYPSWPRPDLPPITQQEMKQWHALKEDDKNGLYRHGHKSLALHNGRMVCGVLSHPLPRVYGPVRHMLMKMVLIDDYTQVQLNGLPVIEELVDVDSLQGGWLSAPGVPVAVAMLPLTMQEYTSMQWCAGRGEMEVDHIKAHGSREDLTNLQMTRIRVDIPTANAQYMRIDWMAMKKGEKIFESRCEPYCKVLTDTRSWERSGGSENVELLLRWHDLTEQLGKPPGQMQECIAWMRAHVDEFRCAVLRDVRRSMVSVADIKEIGGVCEEQLRAQITKEADYQRLETMSFAMFEDHNEDSSAALKDELREMMKFLIDTMTNLLETRKALTKTLPLLNDEVTVCAERMRSATSAADAMAVTVPEAFRMDKQRLRALLLQIAVSGGVKNAHPATVIAPGSSLRLQDAEVDEIAEVVLAYMQRRAVRTSRAVQIITSMLTCLTSQSSNEAFERLLDHVRILAASGDLPERSTLHVLVNRTEPGTPFKSRAGELPLEDVEYPLDMIEEGEVFDARGKVREQVQVRNDEPSLFGRVMSTNVPYSKVREGMASLSVKVPTLPKTVSRVPRDIASAAPTKGDSEMEHDGLTRSGAKEKGAVAFSQNKEARPLSSTSPIEGAKQSRGRSEKKALQPRKIRENAAEASRSGMYPYVPFREASHTRSRSRGVKGSRGILPGVPISRTFQSEGRSTQWIDNMQKDAEIQRETERLVEDIRLMPPPQASAARPIPSGQGNPPSLHAYEGVASPSSSMQVEEEVEEYDPEHHQLFSSSLNTAMERGTVNAADVISNDEDEMSADDSQSPDDDSLFTGHM